MGGSQNSLNKATRGLGNSWRGFGRCLGLNSLQLKAVVFDDWIGQELVTHFVHLFFGFSRITLLDSNLYVFPGADIFD